jgi:hypothetical protein
MLTRTMSKLPHMLTHIIISQQLGGYTASTFPAAIDGYRVEQVAYTKLVNIAFQSA